MRERLQTLLPSVLALSFVMLLAIPAVTAARSGLPPTVSMHPEAAGPGETVEVAGLDFPGDTTVSLQLATPAGPVTLATVATDGEGVFRHVATLPASAVPGNWELRARAANGSTASYAFDSVTPGAASADGAEVASSTSVGNSTGDIVFMLIIASVLGVVFTAVLFAWRMIQEERSQPGMGTGDDLIWSGGPGAATSEPTATDEPFWKKAPREPESTEEVAGTTEHEVPASA